MWTPYCITSTLNSLSKGKIKCPRLLCRDRLLSPASNHDFKPRCFMLETLSYLYYSCFLSPIRSCIMTILWAFQTFIVQATIGTLETCSWVVLERNSILLRWFFNELPTMKALWFLSYQYSSYQIFFCCKNLNVDLQCMFL